MDEEERSLIREMLDRLPDELRASLEQVAAEAGITAEEYISLLMADLDERGIIEAVTNGELSEQDFMNMVMAGECPSCGSPGAVQSDELDEEGDPTVGVCPGCGYTWCLECGAAVAAGETCGHWDVCDGCEEEKDEFGDCGVLPSDCPRIIDWMAESYATACQSTCAWCGAEIPEEDEVFAVGATLRGGIEFEVDENGSGFFLPVAIGQKMVPAIITAGDSEARRQGNDLMFMTCSELCACSLRDALCEQKEVIDRAELN